MSVGRVAIAATAAATALVVLALPAAGQQRTGDWPPPAYPIAVLQGLNKVTARISTFEAPVEQPVDFGALEILVRACHKAPPTEPPEAIAFLEIAALEPGRARQNLYSGWMYASSPAVAAMEHPVYDVWVKDCRSEAAEAAPPAH